MGILPMGSIAWEQDAPATTAFHAHRHAPAHGRRLMPICCNVEVAASIMAGVCSKEGMCACGINL